MSSKGYFARIMGTMWRHRRTAPLSMGARGLWVTMMSFSADQMSDGLVEAHALEMIFRGKPDRKLVEELVSAEVIVRVHDGFQLRDWDQHNITKEKYETHLEKGQARINKLRAKAVETVTKTVETAPVTTPVTRYTSESNGQSNAFRSDQDQDQDQDCLEQGERASAPPRLKSVGQDLIERTQATRALLEEGFRSRGLVVPPCLHDQVPYSKEARAIAESVPLAQLPALIENFFASSWAAKRHFRVSLIVDNPNEYLGKTVKRTNTLPNEEYRNIGPDEAAKMLNDVLEGANA